MRRPPHVSSDTDLFYEMSEVTAAHSMRSVHSGAINTVRPPIQLLARRD